MLNRKIARIRALQSEKVNCVEKLRRFMHELQNENVSFVNSCMAHLKYIMYISNCFLYNNLLKFQCINFHIYTTGCKFLSCMQMNNVMKINMECHMYFSLY